MGNISSDARKDLITKKAYELFLKRGGKPGHEMDDWLTAEKLVDREIQEKNRDSGPSRSESTPSSGQRPVPSPIRNAPSKVSGYKRVSG
jgi:DUF2934 family protein